MARIRTIKPEFFRSEDVSALPMRARLTWIGLWTQCDDHGRTKDNTRLIKGAIWALDDVSLRDVEEDLRILADQGRIARYQVGQDRYLAVVNWHAHQAINRPSKFKHPAPPAPTGPSDPEDPAYCKDCAIPNLGAEPTVNTPGALTESIRNGHTATPAGQTPVDLLTEPTVSTHAPLTEGSRQEGKGKEGRGGDARASVRSTPPAPNGSTPEPPRQCPTHLDDPDPPPCGPCADARRRHDRWTLADAERRRNAPQCRRHRGQPANNCGLCRAEALAAPDDHQQPAA